MRLNVPVNHILRRQETYSGNQLSHKVARSGLRGWAMSMDELPQVPAAAVLENDEDTTLGAVAVA